MSSDLGFSEAVYGLGAGIFFFSYLLFEVPSNMLLERIGARLTMLRILVLWGITSSATMFVSTPMHFYGARFLLGVFEGGFFPGIILYLTYCFRAAAAAWSPVCSCSPFRRHGGPGGRWRGSGRRQWAPRRGSVSHGGHGSACVDTRLDLFFGRMRELRLHILAADDNQEPGRGQHCANRRVFGHSLPWSSNRFRERRWHVGGSLIVSAAALSLTTFTTDSLAVSIALPCAVAFFEFGAAILFWAIPSTYLSKESAPVGIALISSIGVIGGFVSPTLLGFIKARTGVLDYGIYVVTAIMVIGGLMTLAALPSKALKVGNKQG
jgi:MFS family permease